MPFNRDWALNRDWAQCAAIPMYIHFNTVPNFTISDHSDLPNSAVDPERKLFLQQFKQHWYNLLLTFIATSVVINWLTNKLVIGTINGFFCYFGVWGPVNSDPSKSNGSQLETNFLFWYDIYFPFWYEFTKEGKCVKCQWEECNSLQMHNMFCLPSS